MTDTDKPKVNLDHLKKTQEPTQSQAAPSGDLYNHYTSSRISTCFITPGGKRINFTNYEYYTKDPDIIAYLEEQIATNKRCGVTVGEQVNAEDINPMAALKRKHIAEYLEEQQNRDFSGDEVTEAQKIAKAGTLTSTQVAS